MKSTCRLIVHLPFARLSDGPIQVGTEAALIPFPMELLYRVDGNIRKLDSRIERTMPTALMVPAAVRELAQEELPAVAQFLIRTVVGPFYSSLLTVAGGVLPAPHHSVSYIVSDRGDAERFIGAFDYEVLAYGSHTPWVDLDRDIVARAERARQLLGTYDDGCFSVPDVSRVFDAFIDAMMPDHTDETRLVQLVTSLEILLRPGRKEIKQTFATNLSYLLTSSEQLVEDAREVYGLRSALLHGRGAAPERVAGARRAAQRWLGQCLLTLAAMMGDEPSNETLWRARGLMTKASTDVGARETLSQHRERVPA